MYDVAHSCTRVNRLLRGYARMGRNTGHWRQSVNSQLVALLLLLTLLNLAVFQYMTWHDGEQAANSAWLQNKVGGARVVRQPETEQFATAVLPECQPLDKLPLLPPHPSIFPAGFSEMLWSLARDRYAVLLRQTVEPVTQGVHNFKDIYTYKHHGVLLPLLQNIVSGGGAAVVEPGATPQLSAKLADCYKKESHLSEYNPDIYKRLKERVGSVEFCDPADADYTPSKDFACLAYLRNPANWMALKPLSSLLASGRTIKFLLSFRHGNVTAVVKLPQGKFELEPASETVAFHMDRLLAFRRTPPTAWVQIPVDYIKAAAASLGPFYVHWVESEVFKLKRAKAVISRCEDSRLINQLGGSNLKCILASVQLWLWDVHLVEQSTFAGDMRLHRSVKRRRGDNRKPGLKVAPGVKDDEWMERLLRNNNSHADTGRGDGMPLSPTHYLLTRERWDQMAFDAIIANYDRWKGHNSYVLAACAPNLPCHAARAERLYERPSKSTPRFAYIDQGSGFYSSRIRNISVFSPSHQPQFCYVHRLTVERLERIVLFAMRLSNNYSVSTRDGVRRIASVVNGVIAEDEMKRVGDAVYRRLLLPRLPSRIGMVLSHALIKAACRRVWFILAHRTRCLEINVNTIIF
ncbi:hypothetical protein TraAM80_02274 [Trypanosoma rangeli]|uniref:Uncharacterized protein n=1 Tax=Trypanosoma rangeli TaxID=5698 RepID=A0A422NV46_TRYRA|nr:uncharacterized protein TraAM80_02274 [Trypanosoma rangeli]RNF09324.1 hypothetical protein TraAM80_02274 [Trypanosoma rangeli]|eukprot:RNF09324.1 hypothetical protein TraAM80_02274 [Trypanosoma rangeli]